MLSCGKYQQSEILSESNPILNGKNITFYPILNTMNNYGIKIDIKALGHQFLMTAAHMGPTYKMGPYAFESKVVFFKYVNNKINLLEVLDNQSDPPQTKLIATFPIIDKNSATIIFDFDKGMKHIFTRGSTHNIDGQNIENRLKIHNSYLYQAYINNKHLIINHHVKVENKNPFGDLVYEKLNLKYTFTSYRPSEDFQIKQHPNKKLVGYSETHPINNKQFVTHYNTSKKIIFYYTGNIPSQYLQAIKDGINYWNKLLNKDLIIIKQLPPNINAYDPGYNILEWSEENRNHAYTSIQVDPFTGEIIQTYINFPNPINTDRYKLIASFLNKQTNNTTKSHISNISLNNFKSSIIEHEQSVSNNNHQQIKFESLLNNTKNHTHTNKIITHIFGDIIRTLVAHEVGHALGIKHNFAASVSTSVTPKQKDDLYKNYVLDNIIPHNFSTSSSVMDYLPFMFLAISGAKIRNNQLHFPWDKQAFKWLYFSDKDQEITPVSYYCSDADLKSKKWLNCKAFDSFADPIAGTMSILNDNIKLISYQIAKSIYEIPRTAIDSLPSNKLSLFLKPRMVAKKLLKYFISVTDNLRTDAKFIQHQNSIFYQLRSLNTLNLSSEEIFFTPLTLKPHHYFDLPRELISPLIFKIKKLTIDNLEVLSKNTDDNLNYLSKLNYFFNQIEKIFLINYLSYLNHNTFNGIFSVRQDIDDFKSSMLNFISSILFSEGNIFLAPASNYYWPKFYTHGPFKNTTRHRAIDLLFQDSFIDIYYFDKELIDLQNAVYENFKSHMQNIIDTEIDSDFKQEKNKFIRNEHQLFMPLIEKYEI